MDEENILDFNFWPAFADLMLALVLILVLVLFSVTAVISAGTVNLSHVERNQRNMVAAISTRYSAAPVELSRNVYGISIKNPGSYDIVVRNEPGLQRITFSDKILFLPDDDNLNEVGQDVLRVVGGTVRQQLSSIREIQIQGHADTDASGRFPSNVHLASSRAIRVYTFLQKDVGINPAGHLMSATSFGEYKPVQRSEDDADYSPERLRADNATPELKGRNRRVELLLFYRF